MARTLTHEEYAGLSEKKRREYEKERAAERLRGMLADTMIRRYEWNPTQSDKMPVLYHQKVAGWSTPGGSFRQLSHYYIHLGDGIHRVDATVATACEARVAGHGDALAAVMLEPEDARSRLEFMHQIKVSLWEL